MTGSQALTQGRGVGIRAFPGPRSGDLGHPIWWLVGAGRGFAAQIDFQKEGRSFSARLKPPQRLRPVVGGPGKSCPDTRPVDFHPSDEDLSPGTPIFHPSDEDLSPGTPAWGSCFPGSPNARDPHPTDEDLSLHPSEQRPLVGDPESVGTPTPGHPIWWLVGAGRGFAALIDFQKR